MDSRGVLSSSVLGAFGRTPLIALDRLTRGLDGRILAKLENLNPGHSKKDRIALAIIEQAEAEGELQPGQTVIEQTSGNTGTGAAIVCAVKGYPFVAVMSAGNSVERTRMMSALGAEVVLVPQAPSSPPGQVSGADIDLALARTEEIARARGAFRIDQFNRSGNSMAHERNTGPEIWRQSDGAVTAFCDFVGSGGTFAGVSRALRAQKPTVRCYIVEPEHAAVLACKPVSDPNHRIQGGGYSMRDPALLRTAPADGYISVSDDDAIAATRRLAREEGVFAGFSAGANIAAALKLLDGPERGGNIAVLICDTGLKYLSTDLWP